MNAFLLFEFSFKNIHKLHQNFLLIFALCSLITIEVIDGSIDTNERNGPGSGLELVFSKRALVLQCNSSTSRNDIVWSKDGQLISSLSEDLRRKMNYEKMNNSLVLLKLDRTLEGSYKCEVDGDSRVINVRAEPDLSFESDGKKLKHP